jgi:hypothetical protein
MTIDKGRVLFIPTLLHMETSRHSQVQTVQYSRSQFSEPPDAKGYKTRQALEPKESAVMTNLLQGRPLIFL